MIEPSRELLQASSSRSGPTYYTVNDYHEMYKSGQATPLQVVEALLPLIKQGQEPQGLYENAWSDADGSIELALEAAKASTERWAKGKPIGVLDGVPVGIKDDTDVKGLRNFTGMRYIPGLPTFDKKKESAWPVKKLQQAGAIVLGKNRMHELGAGGHSSRSLKPSGYCHDADYRGDSQIRMAAM
jgi:Asp-tRNA(Asn)/Glu-tRNA(Gln) amidotransferase A subunit family amidase